MIKTWIAIFLTAGLPIGVLMGLMAQVIVESKFKKVLTVIGMVIFVTCLTMGITTMQSKDWNGGYCPNCGSHWELRAVTVRHEKIYICPQCYTEIYR